MDFHEEDNDIILKFLEASGFTNILSVLLNYNGSQCVLNLGYNADHQKVSMTALYQNQNYKTSITEKIFERILNLRF